MNKNVVTDTDILTAYKCGWQDEYYITSEGKKPGVYTNKQLASAYDVGRQNYILGSEDRKLDSLKDDEILKMLKGEKNEG